MIKKGKKIILNPVHFNVEKYTGKCTGKVHGTFSLVHCVYQVKLLIYIGFLIGTHIRYISRVLGNVLGTQGIPPFRGGYQCTSIKQGQKHLSK